jgi:signal transduction histidine kinase
VAQEALTNVMRHAGPATVEVRLEYHEEALTVDVTDTGRGLSVVDGRSSATGGGHGIRGMRERVTTLGGEFAAGPLPGGGFAVHARLPLAGEPIGEVAP